MIVNAEPVLCRLWVGLSVSVWLRVNKSYITVGRSEPLFECRRPKCRRYKFVFLTNLYRRHLGRLHSKRYKFVFFNHQIYTYHYTNTCSLLA